jgi:hypothetical protein
MTKLAQDPDTYLAERMEYYMGGESEISQKLEALYEKAGQGDKAAALEAQRIMANEELGGCTSKF